MGRVKKTPTKLIIASKDSPPKRKRGRPRKRKLQAPVQPKEKQAPVQPKEKVIKCSVCLDSTRCRKMKSLQCSHSFHEQCINKWLETNKKCPVCRMSLENENAKGEVNESQGDEAEVAENGNNEMERKRRFALFMALACQNSDSEDEVTENGNIAMQRIKVFARFLAILARQNSDSEVNESQGNEDEVTENGNNVMERISHFKWFTERLARQNSDSEVNESQSDEDEVTENGNNVMERIRRLPRFMALMIGQDSDSD